jgi:NADH-quinone oxidoreductase subunit L
MYQAIVFLPLLGFLIAGLISLVGARARFPGGSPASGEEHHAPAAHAAATHAHDDHGHGHHEPAAAGSNFAEAVTTFFLFISMLLSWYALAEVGFGHHDARVTLLPWINSGDLKIDWALRVDTLTAVMLVVVTSVSAFVHLYSIGYMAEDPYRPRFFS